MKLLLMLGLVVFLLSGCVLSVTATPIHVQGSAAVPVAQADCKRGGWEKLARRDGSAFKNQGACVSYVETSR